MNYNPDEQLMYEAVAAGLKKYNEFKHLVKNHDTMIVIDFRQHSSKKRLYVIQNGQIMRKHHVTHGSKSSSYFDKGRADKFSNKYGSHQSSLGAMLTGEVYYGRHGRSLRLDGLEPGVNDNVRKRAIVIHSARYVTNRYINKKGRAGCSWGCPAVDPAISNVLIDQIKNGSFLYIHY